MAALDDIEATRAALGSAAEAFKGSSAQDRYEQLFRDGSVKDLLSLVGVEVTIHRHDHISVTVQRGRSSISTQANMLFHDLLARLAYLENNRRFGASTQALQLLKDFFTSLNVC